jgi:hypothetical protein
VSGAARKCPETSRYDDPRLPAAAAQRRQVEMVVVRVGDENGVDLHALDDVRHGVRVAMEEAQTIHEERVGENADAIHIDKDRRVSEETKLRTHGPSLMRK